ncbi:uncharacterized protein SCHCODRAFT_02722770 [Schizophyllum commune H4-8]|uniref:uncharacterized protein n=1 Tax=Schizophyllum commune (strain H4-8 / FGSC 9210) TaxID=578458 RepID=UPI00215E4E6F|nr:uncharacterized protein SCHCODRAFT_02722770 [Schizophyllum commune H4-8]KAI5898811.1 hypothetical protein SCHCODRAFT_02722770 [Schizophyllum commune H4-8]
MTGRQAAKGVLSEPRRDAQRATGMRTPDPRLDLANRPTRSHPALQEGAVTSRPRRPVMPPEQMTWRRPRRAAVGAPSRRHRACYPRLVLRGLRVNT